MEPYVLVVGPRSGLLAALDALHIRYGVWTDTGRSTTGSTFTHLAPLAVGEDAARRETDAIAPHGPFTHVIAGTEAAVMPAAIARRALGARKSAKTTVLRCHDKLHMKRHLHERGVPMTPFFDGANTLSAHEVTERLGFPVVLKPRLLSGGRGLEIIRDLEALERAPRRGRLIERYVDAPEVSVETFVNRGSILFENVTEYFRKGHINIVPADLDDRARRFVFALNRRVLEALRIQWGMTHVEMYLTDDGPLFGEIALRPPGGYIMNLLELAWGFDPWRAFVSMELDRPFDFSDRPTRHAAAVVLHPGEGTVAAVRGWDEVRAHPSVVRARLRVAEGDRVAARTGVGVDVGHVILSAASRSILLEAVSTVDGELRIELGGD